MCCVEKKNQKRYKTNESTDILNFALLSIHGAIKLHSQQSRNTIAHLQSIEQNNSFEKIDHSYLNNLFQNSYTLDLLSCPEDVSADSFNFYANHVLVSRQMALDINDGTLEQNSSVLWNKERAKRITGSICYSLHTYSFNKNPAWISKLKSTYNSPKLNLKNFKIGIENEPKAFNKYLNIFNVQNVRMGLVVHPASPWIGYSPDGFIVSTNVLIEIKTAVIKKIDSSISMEQLLSRLSYLKKIDDQYFLKQRHKYYGQIQLGMFILNSNKCHFIIYHPGIDDIYVIEIYRDDDFLSSFIINLRKVYFDIILPYIEVNTQL